MNTILEAVFSRAGGGSIFPRLRRVSLLEEKCPLAQVLPDQVTTITRGGETMAQVIELRGKDYSGLDDELVAALWRARKGFFEACPGDLSISYQAHRVRVSRELGQDNYALPASQVIAQAWASNFRTSYRTRHYLVITTTRGALADQIVQAAKTITGEGQAAKYRTLCDFVSSALERLQPYSPRLLKGDDVAGYWGWLANGRHLEQKLGEWGTLDGILTDTAVMWDLPERRQFYEGPRSRYSAWLFIKVAGDATTPDLLENLFRTRRELAVWQTFAPLDKQDALADITDREKNIVAFTHGGEMILLELDEIRQRINAGDLSVMRHLLAVEVYGDTTTEVEKAVIEISNLIENQGHRVARERGNMEAWYWSRFPSFELLSPRRRSITSENAGHFCNLATAGEGLDSCSWGNAAVTSFKTTHGSEYAFTYHARPDRLAPGHTWAIGGTGLGKTTLLSFLQSGCFKFPNFRALNFDRLRGLEVYTRYHDGEYLDVLVDALGVNPLQLEDSEENRAFLENWFAMLVSRNDSESLAKIGQAVAKLYKLERTDRHLANIADAFGLAGDGSMRQALERWITGPYKAYFTAPRDALDFRSPLVTLDMTMLLDLPDVLGPLSYYLFHKMLLTAREDGGYMVFVDELPKYLQNPIFRPIIDRLLEEIRKSDGVFVGASQSPDAVLESPVAPKFLANIETYLIWPDPRANRRYYLDDPANPRPNLGLTDAEFLWVTERHKEREVLIKRKGGESTIIQTDLKPLGKYLNVFNSGLDTAKRARELAATGGEWKEAFLAA